MLLQRLLALNFSAWFDRAVSEMFQLESWGDGHEDQPHTWIYFATIGSRIGIVGVDGRMHTIMGYFAVRHHYDGQGNLLQRVPVRKDLKQGERLVTEETEIVRHQQREADECSKQPSVGMSF